MGLPQRKFSRGIPKLDQVALAEIVRAALQEDIGSGDITTQSLIPPEQRAKAFILCKQKAVIAGLPVAEAVFRELDAEVQFSASVQEGARVEEGTKIAEIEGSARAILTGERVALNFLQRLSGIATLTAEFVRRLGNPKIRILDTRKTMPLLRSLEKYAVSIGGGQNHRMGLYDAILIKDNHIALVGSVAEAVKLAREKAAAGLQVQIEVGSVEEAQEAIEAGAEALLLDHLSVEDTKRVAELAAGKDIILEASGNVTLDNIEKFSHLPVHCVSIGALTHSAPAVDMSLEVVRR